MVNRSDATAMATIDAKPRRNRREIGAGNEIRTRDPDLGKVVLYQLSYSRLIELMGRIISGLQGLWQLFRPNPSAGPDRLLQPVMRCVDPRPHQEDAYSSHVTAGVKRKAT